MKLMVEGRHVNLYFETTPPLMLGEKFSTIEIAHNAARTMAIMLGLGNIQVASEDGLLLGRYEKEETSWVYLMVRS